MNRLVNSAAARTTLAALLFLFFLQLISDFVAGIYSLNLLAFSLGEGELAELFLVSPEEATDQVMIRVAKNVLTSLIMLSPIVLIAFRRRIPTAVKIILGELMIVCRVVEPLVPPRARMLIAGLGVGCFLVFFPMLMLDSEGELTADRRGLTLASGLAFAIVVSILLRALGSGIDISTDARYQSIAWAPGALAAFLIWTQGSRPGTLSNDGQPGRASAGQEPSRTGKVTVLSLGIMGVLALAYFSFSSPTVIARWTASNYVVISTVLSSLTALFILIFALRPRMISRIPRTVFLLWNAAFVVALFLTIFVHKTPFPSERFLYPLSAARTEGIHQIPLYALLVLSPVVLVDFALLVRELSHISPSIRALGVGFTVSSLCVLMLIFAAIFTLIWDYLPGVGPIFRDRIDVVYLACGLAAVVPALFAKWERPFADVGALFDRASSPGRVRAGRSLVVLFLAAGSIVGFTVVAVAKPEPPVPATIPEALKVMTYNIQAGCDTSGNRNHEGQLEVIQNEQPDIIGLQESDTSRISGGNGDVVRFMADRLHYFSYVGPKTVTGTFGIALLSKWPIDNPETFYLYSEGEQTAAIRANIRVGTVTYCVFVTHLGNYGPIEQQQDILALIRDQVNVILMGDFNFDSTSEQYGITTALLDDALALAETRTNIGRAESIDHVFVSPGTAVTHIEHVGADNSDHPAVLVTIGRSM